MVRNRVKDADRLQDAGASLVGTTLSMAMAELSVRCVGTDTVGSGQGLRLRIREQNYRPRIGRAGDKTITKICVRVPKK